eukprot:RCo035470
MLHGPLICGGVLSVFLIGFLFIYFAATKGHLDSQVSAELWPAPKALLPARFAAQQTNVTHNPQLPSVNLEPAVASREPFQFRSAKESFPGGVPSWVRGPSLPPFTAETQSRIFHHQHPPHCSCATQKFLVFRLLSQGL